MTIQYIVKNLATEATIQQNVYCKNRYNESLKRAIGQAVLQLHQFTKTMAVVSTNYQITLKEVKA